MKFYVQCKGCEKAWVSLENHMKLSWFCELKATAGYGNLPSESNQREVKVRAMDSSVEQHLLVGSEDGMIRLCDFEA